MLLVNRVFHILFYLYNKCLYSNHALKNNKDFVSISKISHSQCDLCTKMQYVENEWFIYKESPPPKKKLYNAVINYKIYPSHFSSFGEFPTQWRVLQINNEDKINTKNTSAQMAI